MRPIESSVVLATSGLGPRCGGIGVVSEQIVAGLKNRYCLELWHHPYMRTKLLRRSSFWISAFKGALCKNVRFVLYEHVDLARVHRTVPGLRRVPYGVFLHGIEVWKPLTDSQRLSLENASILLANSEFTVNEARRINPWLPEARVAWLGISEPPLEQPSLSPSATALMVARMDEGGRHKGHDAVIDSWHKIRSTIPDATLTIVGTGNDRERLERRIATEGLCGVEFKGWVDNAERSRLYRTSRLFLFPSTKDGFGLAAVEAAASAVPILALKNSVLEEIFPQGSGSILIDKQCGDAIARAAIPILEDPVLALTEGTAALKRMSEFFRSDHFVSRLLSALESNGNLPQL